MHPDARPQLILSKKSPFLTFADNNQRQLPASRADRGNNPAATLKIMHLSQPK
jgi:hypothetical protein